MEDMYWFIDVDPLAQWCPDDERYRLSASGYYPTLGTTWDPVGVWRTKEALDVCANWLYHGSPYLAEPVMMPASPPPDRPDAGQLLAG